MKILNRSIGINYPPLIIAEIGINHGGKLEVAKQMVNAAYKTGCEMHLLLSLSHPHYYSPIQV